MARNLWTRLWAHELDPADIPAGAIATFVKAPRRAGEYGFIDAFIAGLDRCPLTHAGLITRSGPTPELVHSTLAGVRREPLAQAAGPHRHGPVFLFAHQQASDRTIDAVVDAAHQHADAADGGRDAYPLGDLLLAAVLLRLRNGSRFDEHAHLRLERLFATVVDPSLSGRMCAAFLCEIFAEVGAPVAPPEERSAFVHGLVAEYRDEPAMPAWAVDFVGAGLVGIAGHAADGAENTPWLGREARVEVVELLRGLAEGGPEAREVVGWVVGPASPEIPVPSLISRLLSLLAPLDAAATGDRSGPIRFSTVNDLIRSPDLAPLGHVIAWNVTSAQGEELEAN